LVSTVGAVIFAVTWLILFLNLWVSLRRGSPSGSNPWDAAGIEWMVPSPPPRENYETAPQIRDDGAIEFPSLQPDGGAPESSIGVSHYSPWPILLSLSVFLVFLGLGLGLMILLAGGIIFIAAILGWAADNIRGGFIAFEPALAERWPFQHLNRVKLGVWVFLTSEVILFSSLIAAYSFVRMNSSSWPHPGQVFSIPIGAVNTIILLSSSLTVVLALAAARDGRRNGVLAGLIATLILGVAFLLNKGLELIGLFHEGFTFQSGLPATTYFVTTGAHGAHVLAGLVVLLYLIVKAFKGGFTIEKHDSIDHFGLYWHFVDIVWVFLFPIFYLI